MTNRNIKKLILSMTALIMAAVLTSCGLIEELALKPSVTSTATTSAAAEKETETTASKETLESQIEGAIIRGEETIKLRCDSIDEVGDIVEQLRYKPEYFYLGDVIEYEFDGYWCTIDFNLKFDNIQSAKAQVKGVADEVMSEIPEGADDYTKALIIHDWLVIYVDYDESAANSQDIYGALVDRKCVCGGYAMAFRYLMELAGLECYYLSGNAYSEAGSGPHAWNGAVLDGEIYYFDVTWDDPVNSDTRLRRNYFAVTSEEIGKSHIPDEGQEIPYSEARACNYFYRNDLIAWETSIDEIVRLIELQGYQVEFKCASREIYEGILDILYDGEALYDIIWESNLEANGCMSSRDEDLLCIYLEFY